MNVKTLVSAFAVAAMMSYGSTTAKAQNPETGVSPPAIRTQRMGESQRNMDILV